MKDRLRYAQDRTDTPGIWEVGKPTLDINCNIHHVAQTARGSYAYDS